MTRLILRLQVGWNPPDPEGWFEYKGVNWQFDGRGGLVGEKECDCCGHVEDNVDPRDEHLSRDEIQMIKDAIREKATESEETRSQWFYLEQRYAGYKNAVDVVRNGNIRDYWTGKPS